AVHRREDAVAKGRGRVEIELAVHDQDRPARLLSGADRHLRPMARLDVVVGLVRGHAILLFGHDCTSTGRRSGSGMPHRRVMIVPSSPVWISISSINARMIS